MNQYFLYHNAWIEKVEPDTLLALGGGWWNGDAARGITVQHIPPPFGREVVGVDRECPGFAIAKLDGIAGIASFIDMQCWQCAYLYLAVSRLQVTT